MFYPIIHIAFLGLRLGVEYIVDEKQFIWLIQVGPYTNEDVLWAIPLSWIK